MDGHEHYHEYDNFVYKSFFDGSEKNINEILSFNNKDLWKSLDIEKVLHLLKNKESNGLDKDQEAAFVIYLAIKSLFEKMVEFEIMDLAEIAVYELKKSGYLV